MMRISKVSSCRMSMHSSLALVPLVLLQLVGYPVSILVHQFEVVALRRRVLDLLTEHGCQGHRVSQEQN